MKTFKASPKFLVIASITILLVVGYGLALYVGQFNRNTAWLPVTLFYWLWILLSIAASGKFPAVKDWFRSTKDKWFWKLAPLVLVAGMILQVIPANLTVLKLDYLLFTHVLISLINPWFEEVYWRGFIMDTFKSNHPAISFLISTVPFALSHPLLLGVNVPALSAIPFFVGTCITGTCWWLSYYKTKSLRWPVATHILVDLFSLMVYILSNTAKLPS